MGGWQGKRPPARELWCLRCRGTEHSELQPASKLCCLKAHHFLKIPDLLRGFPSIQQGRDRALWGCLGAALHLASTKWVDSYRERCHSYSMPAALNPGEVVSGSVSCAVVPKSWSGVRRGQTQEFVNVLRFPSFFMLVKIFRGFTPRPSLLMQYWWVLAWHLGICKSRTSFTSFIQM